MKQKKNKIVIWFLILVLIFSSCNTKTNPPENKSLETPLTSDNDTNIVVDSDNFIYPDDFKKLEVDIDEKLTILESGYLKDNMIWVYGYSGEQHFKNNIFILIDYKTNTIVNDLHSDLPLNFLTNSRDKLYFLNHDESLSSPLGISIFNLVQFDFEDNIEANWYTEGDSNVSPLNRYLIGSYIGTSIYDLQEQKIFYSDDSGFYYISLDFIGDTTFVAYRETTPTGERNGLPSFKGLQIYDIETGEERLVESDYFKISVTKNNFYLFPKYDYMSSNNTIAYYSRDLESNEPPKNILLEKFYDNSRIFSDNDLDYFLTITPIQYASDPEQYMMIIYSEAGEVIGETYFNYTDDITRNYDPLNPYLEDYYYILLPNSEFAILGSNESGITMHRESFN